MLFKKKSAAPQLPSVCIRHGAHVLYEGLLKDIPIREDVLIQKSILFFDDPEPCFIHRGAVRVRLTEELHRELLQKTPSDCTPGPLMLAYADLEEADHCELL